MSQALSTSDTLCVSQALSTILLYACLRITRTPAHSYLTSLTAAYLLPVQEQTVLHLFDRTSCLCNNRQYYNRSCVALQVIGGTF